MKRTVVILLVSVFLVSCSAVNQGTKADSYQEKEVLLLHMEGEDASANFLDSSSNPKKVQTRGGAAISTAQAKLGAASGHFDGSGAYLALAASNDWEFGAGDFTIDFWVKRNGLQNYAGIVCSVRQSDYVGFSVQIQRDGFVELASDADGSWGQDVITKTGIADNIWTHVAIVRFKDMVTIYFDGAAVTTKNVAGYVFTSASNKGGLTIGRLHPDVNDYYLNGNLDEVRVTKGVARWTSDFDPLEAENVLFLHMDKTDGSKSIVDSSSSILKVVPFGTAVLSTGKAKAGGSSLYLDGGLENYVTIENSPAWDFGDGDFTIDCWFYIANSEGQKTIFAGNTDWCLGAWFVGKHGNLMNYYASSNGTSWNLISDRYDQFGGGEGSIYITPNEWHHFAYVRHGDVWTGYIDGKQDFTKTVSGKLVKKDEVKRIGLWGNSTYGFDGYIDEFRVTKGVARWTEEFALPDFPAEKKAVKRKPEKKMLFRGTKTAVKVENSVPIETVPPTIKTQEEYFEGLIGADNLKQNEAVRAFIKSGQKGKEFLLMKKKSAADETIIWKVDAVLSQIE